MIWTRMVATALIAAAGVALVWLGLGLCRVADGGNDVGHALVLLCALGAVVAGGWLCWQAAAGCSAELLVNVASYRLEVSPQAS